MYPVTSGWKCSFGSPSGAWLRPCHPAWIFSLLILWSPLCSQQLSPHRKACPCGPAPGEVPPMPPLVLGAAGDVALLQLALHSQWRNRVRNQQSQEQGCVQGREVGNRSAQQDCWPSRPHLRATSQPLQLWRLMSHVSEQRLEVFCCFY